MTNILLCLEAWAVRGVEGRGGSGVLGSTVESLQCFLRRLGLIFFFNNF